MNLKKSSLLVVAACVLPLGVQAESGPAAAVNACVKSFVEAYLPNHPVRTVKKRMPAPSPIDTYFRPREYTVALAAHGAQTGRLIAQAHCIASNKGVVVVLETNASPEYLAKADFKVSLR